MTELRTFRNLFAIPLRNGLTRPKAVRGAGEKMINMGELFSHDRIADIPMDLVLLSSRERDDFMVKTNDLLFARQSLVLSGAGKCSLYTGASYATFESHIIRARLNEAISDPRFYYYFFRSPAGRSAIEAIVEQVAAAGIRGSDLAGISVPYPPVPEQRAIASILSALDDKIELNRKMSATLEAIARALFKSWFVDFDPVRAKAEGRDPGLPTEIAALFPGSIPSVHGITHPSGWCPSPLKALSASIQRGISPAYTDVGVLVINQKCIRDGHVDLSRARRHDSAMKSVENRTVLRGDVLVNSTGVGTLGRVAPVVALPEGKVTVDSHVSIVRPDPTAVEPMYLGSAMLNLQSEIEMLGEGTTGQTELSRARLGALMLVTPPKPIQERYARFVEPLFLKVAKNAQQSETLAALRDALLPKLISGELRVGDAERVLAASA